MSRKTAGHAMGCPCVRCIAKGPPTKHSARRDAEPEPEHEREDFIDHRYHGVAFLAWSRMRLAKLRVTIKQCVPPQH
jgi:hypothetical protein